MFDVLAIETSQQYNDPEAHQGLTHIRSRSLPYLRVRMPTDDEGFLTGPLDIPQGEFCVYGTVMLT